MTNQDKMEKLFFKWMYDTYGDLHLTITEDFFEGTSASIFSSKLKDSMGRLVGIRNTVGVTTISLRPVCQKIINTFGEKMGPPLIIKYFKSRFPEFNINYLTIDYIGPDSERTSNVYYI